MLSLREASSSSSKFLRGCQGLLMDLIEAHLGLGRPAGFEIGRAAEQGVQAATQTGFLFHEHRPRLVEIRLRLSPSNRGGIVTGN